MMVCSEINVEAESGDKSANYYICRGMYRLGHRLLPRKSRKEGYLAGEKGLARGWLAPSIKAKDAVARAMSGA